MHGVDGRDDMAAAVAGLASRLPDVLRPLAPVVYNYAWSWTDDGRALFHDLDPYRWHLSLGDPVRLLEQLTPAAVARIERSPELVERIGALAERTAAAVGPRRPASPLAAELPGPVAFLCSEFAIHASLPVYAGGLGVLAGDILKEASDLDLPYVGVGLLYRRGYFQQRLDLTGWQHEWWRELDPEHSAVVRVTVDGNHPLLVSVPLFDRQVACQVWRVDVGRVPLYLLDTQRPENTAVDRWITARLYEANAPLRLAQYGVLGVGGVRALHAMGHEPAVVHLNEGHPAFAALELAARAVADGDGADLDAALDAARDRVVFTTHTPVPAGNETYPPAELTGVLGAYAGEVGLPVDRFLDLARIHPGRPDEPVGLTPLALRLSRHANGVSQRHGVIARELWHPLFPDRAPEGVPIGAVTNGVHLPTFMAPPMRAVLDRHLDEGWVDRASDPAVWRAVDDIPAAELWAARCAARAGLVERVRRNSVRDRLQRGEGLDYVEAAAETFDDDTLTVGFARRVAGYKRLHLISHDPARALALLDDPHPLQLLIAGKAHPADEQAKAMMQRLFALKGDPRVGRRVAVLENYDLRMASWLVAGCDVWVNLPRPPNEASGTSGMKAVLNGGLNLSVLDGWWAEGYDGSNGWAIEGELDPDETGQDERHAARLYELLESEVVPRFHDRDADGIPHGWVEMMRASLRSLAPRFCATRMLEDYVRTVYTR